jgi:hypothetical protein
MSGEQEGASLTDNLTGATDREYYSTFDPADQAVMSAAAANELAAATGSFTQAVVRYIQTQSLLIMLVASVGLLVQTSHDCSRSPNCTTAVDGKLAYGVAVAAVSTMVCLVYLIGAKYYHYDFQQFATSCALFLCAWWLIAAWVLTFDAPYTFTGNGYFSIWVATVASTLFAQQSSPMVRRLSKSILGRASAHQTSWIFLASVVELVASAHVCSNVQDAGVGCTNELGWAIAVGAVSSFICLVLMLTSNTFLMPHPLLRNVGLLLVALWIPGCYVLTFRAPFVTFGNGYFASWSALFLSVYFTQTVWARGTDRIDSFASEAGGGNEDSTAFDGNSNGPLTAPYVIATHSHASPQSSPPNSTTGDGMIDQGEDYATI